MGESVAELVVNAFLDFRGFGILNNRYLCMYVCVYVVCI